LNRWSDDPGRSLVEAQRLTEQAIEEGPNEPRAHHAAALVAMFSKDFHHGCAAIEQERGLRRNQSAQQHSCNKLSWSLTRLRRDRQSSLGGSLWAMPLWQSMQVSPAFMFACIFSAARADCL